MGKFKAYASVLLDVGIDQPLDYGIPNALVEKARPGMRVHVPLKGHERGGMIIEILEKPNYKSVLPISKLVDEATLPSDLFQLALWMQSYYLTPLRHILKLMFPPLNSQRACT